MMALDSLWPNYQFTKDSSKKEWGMAEGQNIFHKQALLSVEFSLITNFQTKKMERKLVNKC